MHLPAQPDHQTVEQNWDNSYFTEHVHIVISYFRSVQLFDDKNDDIIDVSAKTSVVPIINR